MMNWISVVWCKRMHTKAMWPIHGRYIVHNVYAHTLSRGKNRSSRTGAMTGGAPQTELQHSTVSLYQ